MSLTGGLDSFRAAYGLWIAVAIAVQLPGHIRWVQARGDERGMPQVLGWFTLPRLNTGVFAAVGFAFVTGLVLAAVWERGAPWLAIGAGVAALFYFSQVIGLPEVRRKPNSVPIILLILGVAGLAGRGDDAGRIAWLGLIAIKAIVAQIYFSSAWVKLRHSGWRWGRTPTLQIALLRYRLRDDNRAALWLARHATACQVASLLTLVFEATFWLVIPFPALAWVYLPAGVIFHLGTAVFMRIHYWIYVFPAYLVFIVAR